jgi:hypothetical protein
VTAAPFVGAIVDPIDDERSELVGACFAVAPGGFMTADHVIEAARERGRRLYVIGPGLEPIAARVAMRHPEHDVATVTASCAVRPFDRCGPPQVSEPATVYGVAGRELHTTLLTVTDIEAVSTAKTRGTSAEALRAPTAERAYRYLGGVLADPADNGYSGGPVVQDGVVVGVLTLRRTYNGVARGVAMLLNQDQRSGA